MIARSLRNFALVLAIPLLGVACASDAGDAGASEDTPRTAEISAAPAPTLEDATELGVMNARMPIPGIVTSGQPTVEQVEALTDAGYTNFISLRPEAEDGAGWEETHSVDGGYGFDRLPITGAGSLTRENVEAFAALLEEAGDEPTVLYCASSNRVGAMLALKAFWLDGTEAEDALQLGLDAGMTRLAGPVTEMLGLEGSN